MGEELLDGPVLVLEIKLHVCGGEGEYEGVEEVSYRLGGEPVDEVAKAVIKEEVEDDETSSVRSGVRQVEVAAFSGQVS